MSAGPSPRRCRLTGRRRRRDAFARDGALARARRQARRARGADAHGAGAWPQAIETRSALVAEAGTGVGKTFAYLVPTLLSGARALISTATKSLQDQLFLRDLPRLRDALQLPVSMALLKGRGSYLCLHRMKQARQSAPAARPLGGAHAGQGGAVVAADRQRRPGRTRRAGRAQQRDPAGHLVARELPGQRVPASSAPAMSMKARREAMAADLVVVNHHLFFADMALRDTGVAELLPSVEVAVFDEAHQLAEAGVQFLGTTLGTAQVLDFARDMLGRRPAAGARPGALAGAGGAAATRPRASCAWPRPGRCASCAARSSCAGTSAPARADFSAALQASGRRPAQRRARGAGHGQRSCRPTSPSSPSAPRQLGALAERVRQPAAARATCAGSTCRRTRRGWSSRRWTSAMRCASRWPPAPKAWIFTSATLGDDERLTLVHRAGRPGGRAHAAPGQPVRLRRACAAVRAARAFPKPNEAGASGRGGRAGRTLRARAGRAHLRADHHLRALQAIGEQLRAEFEAQRRCDPGAGAGQQRRSAS